MKIVLLPEEEFKSYLDELKLAIDDIKSNSTDSTKPKYYRNKDLKEIFGLSNNTIIKFRRKNILPYTYLDSIYFYPVDELTERLKGNSNLDLI